ncbi:toll/interleukin-1 receptor domain-containing protein [Thalassomonas viridans]|uniref:Toll/interleukin-1 receptor domain-containing protein n=1 Tax=Thalassomonas viridans TaxID=137584 RepID=A0AAE9Z4E7_9GAMM|nr:toll/interleukin-1 receptor domain-containing protein [Thalassomonas viridans]WDE05063.1 toll/interleukin-1 receptor domain-containing protein [Thalassomonas viridans]
MSKVFFSYSHRDENMRDELEVHLSMLKRQGLIETWHDRRIDAGSDIDKSIAKSMEDADVILLLVSPYFLASNYCYEIEMERALNRHQAKSATVIPIILEPCDWMDAPFGKLMATPTDGKPISKFSNIHEAFLDVVTSIKRVIKNKNNERPHHENTVTTKQEDTTPTTVKRSSNLRLKKSFSDLDKDNFQKEGFVYMRNYFEESLKELRNRNSFINFSISDSSNECFSVVVYVNGDERSSCTIRIGAMNRFINGITYSNTKNGSENSFNEQLTVDNDGYSLFFKSLGMSYHFTSNKQASELSAEGAAELYWTMLITPLQ